MLKFLIAGGLRLLSLSEQTHAGPSAPVGLRLISWTSDGETIIVWCDGIRFTHHILSDPDDDAPEFFSDDDQDPSVIVKLTDEERHELERAA